MTTLTAAKIRALFPLVALAFGILTAGATAQYQITENKDDIKVLKKDREMQIRMEERQISMKEDILEIKKIVAGLRK